MKRRRSRSVIEGCSFVIEEGILRARLIREGISKNGNNWTRNILEKLVTLVDGIPVNFYDVSERNDGTWLTHWETIRQKMPPGIRRLLPERLPAATIGTIKNPKLVEGSDGKAEIVGDVQLYESAVGWFRSLLEKVKNLGLSIHVPEDGVKARPHPAGGVEPMEVTRVTGMDVVSFPSAGGAFLPVLEAIAKEGSVVKMKDLVKRLLRLVPKEKAGVLEDIEIPPNTVEEIPVLLEEHEDFVSAVLEALEMKPEDDKVRGAIIESLYRVAPKEDVEPKPKSKSKKRVKPEPIIEDDDPEDDDPDVDLSQVAQTLREIARENSESMLEARLTASGLPKPIQEFARNHFTTILESQGRLRAKEVDTFVSRLKKSLGTGGQSVLEGEPDRGSVTHAGPYTNGDQAVAAFQAMLNREEFGYIGEGDKRIKVPAFRSLRHAYGVLTGDVYCQGAAFYNDNRRFKGALESYDMNQVPGFVQYRSMRGGLTEAAMTTATFPLLLSDHMHKAMVKEYLQRPLQWRLVGTAETVTDFKTWYWHRVGEMPNLSVVAEAGAYSDLGTMPVEEQITLAITKKGGTFTLTWEMIVNDDLGKLRDFPGKAARAAERTLNKAVFDLLATNALIYDGIALAASAAVPTGHANLTASAISYANLKTLRKNMHLQKDISAAELGRVQADRVLVPPSNFDAAYELLFSDGKPSLDTVDPNTALGGGVKTMVSDNMGVPNVLRSKYGLSLWEVAELEGDVDSYWMTANPSTTEMIKVGFFMGRETPELFVQDLDRVGSFFTNEQIITKIRHIYKAAVADFRGFQAGIP